MVIASNLPIDKLDALRPMFRTWAKLQGKKMRIRFRGPRHDLMRLTTLKRNAVGFSVYMV